jgi:hypothetical protein
MTLKEGIYELYTSLSAIGAVTAFKEKYSHLPDDVQRQGDVMLAGPVKQIGYMSKEDEMKYYTSDEESK